MIFICIGLGVINLIIPWDDILNRFLNDETRDIPYTYDEAEKNFSVRYEDVNPSMRASFQRDRIEQKWMNKGKEEA